MPAGARWDVVARLKLDGVIVPGSETAASGIGQVSSSAALGPILVHATAGQVLTVEIEHDNLTGALEMFTVSIAADIN